MLGGARAEWCLVSVRSLLSLEAGGWEKTGQGGGGRGSWWLGEDGGGGGEVSFALFFVLLGNFQKGGSDEIQTTAFHFAYRIPHWRSPS